MSNIFKDQDSFITAGNIEVGTYAAEKLALKLISEEYNELMYEEGYFSCSLDIRERASSIKECIDLIYVSAQYMNSCVGHKKAKKVWDIVHKSNMSKVSGTHINKRADGKILKSDVFDKDEMMRRIIKVLESDE